jgi:hypothetical protein
LDVKNYEDSVMLSLWTFKNLGDMNNEGEFLVEPAFLEQPLKDIASKVIRDLRFNDCTPVLPTDHWKVYSKLLLDEGKNGDIA